MMMNIEVFIDPRDLNSKQKYISTSRTSDEVHTASATLVYEFNENKVTSLSSKKFDKDFDAVMERFLAVEDMKLISGLIKEDLKSKLFDK